MAVAVVVLATSCCGLVNVDVDGDVDVEVPVDVADDAVVLAAVPVPAAVPVAEAEVPPFDTHDTDCDRGRDRVGDDADCTGGRVRGLWSPPRGSSATRSRLVQVAAEEGGRARTRVGAEKDLLHLWTLPTAPFPCP